MKSLIVVLLAIFFLGGCAGVQVDLKPRVNTEIGFDFASLSKFHVAYKKSAQPEEFSQKDIAQLLTQYFEAKGYKLSKTKEDSDFYFVLHSGIKCIKQVEKDYESLDVYPRFKHDLKPIVIDGKDLYKVNPYVETIKSISSADLNETRRYKNNMLLIEILDNKTNKIVWQGFEQNDLDKFPTKEEKIAYINNVLKSLFKGFPDHK